MSVVVEDLTSGHSVSEDEGVLTAERVFHVSGLIALKNLQLMEALSDPLIPVVGDAYPDVATYPFFGNLTCLQREAEPGGPNAAKVTITYSNVSRNSFTFRETPVTNEGPDLKRIGSAAVEKRTTKDASDDAMTLTPPAAYSTLPTYASEADTLVAVGELVFVRVEKSPPAASMRTLVGLTNSLSLSSYAANTLVLWSIDATGNDGLLWDVEYVFRYRSDGWLHRDIWKHSDGKPAEGAVEETFEVLGEANFGVLGLDFSDTQSPV